jgi:hypothetical protein
MTPKELHPGEIVLAPPVEYSSGTQRGKNFTLMEYRRGTAPVE